jgi:hypothetical protein
LNRGKWRHRFAYVAMSLIVGWHAVAVMLAPAPDNSEALQALRLVFQPYLSLLRLDNNWSFFAPSVGKHAQFRYVVEDAAGTEHTFVPTEETSSLAGYVLWREFKYLYEGIMEDPDGRGDAIGAFFCRKHASLRPVSVTLVQVREQDFWREQFLRGKRPLDSEFVIVNPLRRVDCQVGPEAAAHPRLGVSRDGLIISAMRLHVPQPGHADRAERRSGLP